MMKHQIIYLLLGVVFLSSCSNQNKYLEKEAIDVFDQMSLSIGELESCSYTLVTKSAKKKASLSEVEHDVYMRGPNKLYVHSNGEEIAKGYWYNGEQFAFYNFKEASFDTVPAPENIILTIDAIHQSFGIDFPAADFFYPSFTDDMIDNFDSIIYLQEESVNNEKITQVLGINDEISVYFSIADNGEKIYPIGLSIYSKADVLIYDADFYNWRFNPVLPDFLFEFEPSEGDKRVKLEPKNKK